MSHSQLRIRYRDDEGWPESADGIGASLELFCDDANPALPESWIASKSYSLSASFTSLFLPYLCFVLTRNHFN
jgi:hypothetical protein